MAEVSNELHEQARAAHDELMVIGDVSLRFAGIKRLVCYPAEEREPTRYENDAEHSYMLALSAVHLAATYHPELDVGLVAQFCFVHDLPEVYAGDTPSYRLTSEQRAAKEAAEHDAVARLLAELPAHLARLLERYEEQVEPEARFVRFVDKLMPAIVHRLAADENRAVFFGYYNIQSVEDLEESSRRRTLEVQAQFPEFKLLSIIRELTSASSRAAFFPKA